VIRWFITAMALLPVTTALAEVTHSSEHGFTVRHSINTEAEAFVIYRTMDAANLYMDVETGGCFCERLPGSGRVEHLRIIYFSPGKELRFDGALGPLQTMAAQGRMVWKIEDNGSGNTITFTYKVFGHPEGGLGAIAPAVDGVIGEQLSRLEKRLGSGQG